VYGQTERDKHDEANRCIFVTLVANTPKNSLLHMNLAITLSDRRGSEGVLNSYVCDMHFK
jgi:hypothetical protein